MLDIRRRGRRREGLCDWHQRKFPVIRELSSFPRSRRRAVLCETQSRSSTNGTRGGHRGRQAGKDQQRMCLLCPGAAKGVGRKSAAYSCVAGCSYTLRRGTQRSKTTFHKPLSVTSLFLEMNRLSHATPSKLPLLYLERRKVRPRKLKEAPYIRMNDTADASVP